MSTSNPMLDAALSYAARGWHVLPLHSCQEGRCSCGKTECNAGKHSRTRHGVAEATNDGRKSRSWWRRWPDANVAIATGAASGLVVIDLDNKNGKAGEASFRTMADQHKGVPPTMTVATGNGLHLYFQHPGVAVVNSVCKLGDGVDVKADGGYVVAPPSVHQSGRRYQLVNDCEVLDLPQWLSERIRPSTPS